MINFCSIIGSNNRLDWEMFLTSGHVNSLSVENMTSLSDHRPISLDLKFNINTIIQHNITGKAHTCSKKSNRLNINNIDTYRQVLGNEMSIHNITPIMNKLDDNSENITKINKITTLIIQLYTNAANKISACGKIILVK